MTNNELIKAAQDSPYYLGMLIAKTSFTKQAEMPSLGDYLSFRAPVPKGRLSADLHVKTPEQEQEIKRQRVLNNINTRYRNSANPVQRWPSASTAQMSPEQLLNVHNTYNNPMMRVLRDRGLSDQDAVLEQERIRQNTQHPFFQNPTQ